MAATAHKRNRNRAADTVARAALQRRINEPLVLAFRIDDDAAVPSGFAATRADDDNNLDNGVDDLSFLCFFPSARSPLSQGRARRCK